VRDKHPGNTN